MNAFFDHIAQLKTTCQKSNRNCRNQSYCIANNTIPRQKQTISPLSTKSSRYFKERKTFISRVVSSDHSSGNAMQRLA
ncbi:hypothetical protein ACFQI9_42305, partial [Paraburkholderia dipogonis]|uniref:hypothetical protein n=1 Tax=Paraburkholderia dipogonis TaxID=1211383 RepID=UPI003621DD87